MPDNIVESVEWETGKKVELETIITLTKDPKLLGPRVVTVIDVTTNRDMQKMGIDCIACLEDGVCWGLDVKADKYIGQVGAYNTKNVLVEWSCKYKSGKTSPGWANYSKAKYILFVSPTNNWYLLNLPVVKDLIKSKPELMRRLTTAHPKGVPDKTMYNLMIPMDSILGYCFWDMSKEAARYE